MKKARTLLFVTILIVSVYFLFMNCKTINVPLEKDTAEKMYSIDSVIINYINSNDMEVDSLNSLLSQICGKEQIEITDWKDKYSGNGLPDNTYIGYRLAILYRYKIEDIIDGESRLNFFIASVRISDYEILNLLNFQDPALEMNSCYGETALTVAVRQNNTKMVEYLLKNEINKNKREFAACYDDAVEEQNAYEIALSLGYKEIIVLLENSK